MPIAIWIAVIVEVIRAAIAQEDYEGFAVLLMLQFANAIVGFIEESKAGDAIAALKSQLAPQCHVCREGKWMNMPAKNLVPGDLLELKLGDVVPADAILLDGQPLQVDQSALTGESLPATIHPWGHLKMGSAVKRGESKAIVSATGARTFFGTAAAMISSVNELGNLAKILLHVRLRLCFALSTDCSLHALQTSSLYMHRYRLLLGCWPFLSLSASSSLLCSWLPLTQTATSFRRTNRRSFDLFPSPSSFSLHRSLSLLKSCARQLSPSGLISWLGYVSPIFRFAFAFFLSSCCLLLPMADRAEESYRRQAVCHRGTRRDDHPLLRQDWHAHAQQAVSPRAHRPLPRHHP